MIIKVDGIENKELGKNPVSLMKFLKENTHSGKVEPMVEMFKRTRMASDNSK